MGNRREREKKIVSEEKQLVGEVMRLPLVKEVLRVSEATWLANPFGAKILDIAFKPRRGKRNELVGTGLFQMNDCVGVVLCEDGERRVVLEKVEQDRQLQEMIHNGASVAVMTVEELAEWGGFYDQIKESGLLDEVGERAMDFSGLRRLLPVEYDLLLRDLNGFLSTEVEEWLAEVGVKEIVTEGLGQIDVAFLDEDGERMVVPMSHIRTGYLDGEVLVEKVTEGEVWVPGLIVRREGENKREAYRRANNLRTYYKNRFGDGYRVEFPVVSSGQISLWRKLGIKRSLEASLPGVDLTAEEVIRFLYLGESNVDPGELAKIGLSMPGGGGEFPGLDVVFYKRDRYGNRQFVPIDGFLGLDLQKRKLGREGLEGLVNVKGIVIVPDEWSAKEMHSYTKLILKDFNYRTRGAGGYILYLTPSLFAEWKARGEAFLSNGNGGVESLSRKVEYGSGVGDVKKVDLHIVRLKPEIGGQKMYIEETGKGGSVSHVLDWGQTFVGNRSLRQLTSKEPTAIGIRRSLEIGDLPMVAGFYDVEYLLASIEPKIGYASTSDAVTSFLRAELVLRSDFEEVARVAGKPLARKIFKWGKKDVDFWYGEGGERILANVMLSHSHIDHAGLMMYLRRQARGIGSAETIRHIYARGVKGTWRERPDISLIAHSLQGPAYQVVRREMVSMYWSGQSIRLSPDLQGSFYFVDHSIGGTTAIGIDDSEGNGLMVYTADLKSGAQTEKAVGLIAERQYPIIVTESTNIEDGFKPSIGITEEVVKETLQRIVKGGGGDAVVAIMPPNHMGRLETIMEVADGQGRVVAIDPSMAEVIEQLRVARDMEAPLSADGFVEKLPEIGVDVALWWPPYTRPKTFAKILKEKAERGPLGVVDGERLSRQGPKLAIVTTPYRILRHDFGGVSWRNGLVVVYLSYYPYEMSAKFALGESLAWVNMVDREQLRGSKRARMYMDFSVIGHGGRVDPYIANYEVGGKKQGLHAGGHATFLELVEIIDGMLGRVYKGKTVVLVHGEQPVNFARDLKKKIGARDLQIISSLDRYDPAKPISRPGFKLRLA